MLTWIFTVNAAGIWKKLVLYSFDNLSQEIANLIPPHFYSIVFLPIITSFNNRVRLFSFRTKNTDNDNQACRFDGKRYLCRERSILDDRR